MSQKNLYNWILQKIMKFPLFIMLETIGQDSEDFQATEESIKFCLLFFTILCHSQRHSGVCGFSLQSSLPPTSSFLLQSGQPSEADQATESGVGFNIGANDDAGSASFCLHFSYQKTNRGTKHTHQSKAVRGKWIQLSRAFQPPQGCTPQITTLMGGTLRLGECGILVLLPFKQLGPCGGHVQTKKSAYCN